MCKSEKSITYHVDVDQNCLEKIINELVRAGIPAGEGNFALIGDAQKAFIVVPQEYSEKTSEIIAKYTS